MKEIINALFVNWKTTLAGAGAAALQAAAAYFNGQTGIWPYISAGLVALLGFLAKDSNVTGGTKAA